MNALEFEKFILEKLSFNRNLFDKELKKAFARLPESDYLKLQQWCKDRFPMTETNHKEPKELLQEKH